MVSVLRPTLLLTYPSGPCPALSRRRKNTGVNLKSKFTSRISKGEQVCVESMYLDSESDENGIEQSTGEVKSLAVGPDRFGRHWEFSEPLS